MRLVDSGGLTLLAPVHRARGLLGRGLGWMGCRQPPGGGLWIEPCRSIHTCFMRFPLDVFFISPEGQIVRTIRKIQPWRMAWGGSEACSVLETPPDALPPSALKNVRIVRLVD